MISADANKCLQFFPATDAAKELAEDLLRPVLRANGSDENWFRYAVAEGILNVSEIQLDSKPIAVIWWRTEHGKLIVEMIRSINPSAKLPMCAFDAALVRLAQLQTCSVIEGRTRRKGFISELGHFGWQAESVNLVKTLK